MIYNLLVVFFLIFCFPIIGPLNSAYIALGLAITKVCCCGRINLLVRLYRNNYIKILVWSSLGITILCGGWTFFLGVNDYSLTAAFFSLFVGLCMTLIVIASLSYKAYDYDFFERLIVNIFVIQACVSIAAFVSPTVREIVHNFQFANEVEKSEEAYAGFRGLAISGRLFFEFAATCGLVSFVQFKRIITFPSATIVEYFKLFLIILCGFFAGRTSMIGFGFGFIYLLVHKSLTKTKVQIVGRMIFSFICVVAVCIVIVPSNILSFITQHVFPWVFDLFIKYHETGSTEGSASFNHLNEMYKYVTITPDEWIWGSGKFMDLHGGYYKQVDGGYIRHLLYWGVLGSILNILYGLIYFVKPYLKCKNFNEHLYIILLLIFTFFLHYKGDLATTSRFYHVPLVMILLPYVFKPINKLCHGTNRHCPAVGR